MSKSLSQKIEALIHFSRGRKEMTLRDLQLSLGPSGPAFITLILSFPFVVFLAVPGLSMIFGVIILVTGIRYALYRSLWIPFKKKKISGDKLAHILTKTLKFLKKVEKYIRPRGTIYQQSPFLHAFNGFVLTLSGFFLSLPHPSGMNFLPGLAVFLLSLGILEEDLWMIVGSYVAFLLNLSIILLPLFQTRS